MLQLIELTGAGCEARFVPAEDRRRNQGRRLAGASTFSWCILRLCDARRNEFGSRGGKVARGGYGEGSEKRLRRTIIFRRNKCLLGFTGDAGRLPKNALAGH